MSGPQGAAARTVPASGLWGPPAGPGGMAAVSRPSRGHRAEGTGRGGGAEGRPFSLGSKLLRRAGRRGQLPGWKQQAQLWLRAGEAERGSTQPQARPPGPASGRGAWWRGRDGVVRGSWSTRARQSAAQGPASAAWGVVSVGHTGPCTHCPSQTSLWASPGRNAAALTGHAGATRERGTRGGPERVTSAESEDQRRFPHCPPPAL